MTCAYAKLLGSDEFVYYMTSESITLGRSSLSSSGSEPADIPISPSRCVSRLHCKLSYNRSSERFELKCLSKNGVFVDGSWIGPESKPVPLRSRALIQIGPRLFYFLLPKQAEQDLSSSEDEDAPARVRLPMFTVSSGKKWNRTAREKLRRAIMRYGYGRWKLLEDAVGDPEFSRQNIEVFATQLVYQLKQHCGDPILSRCLQDILSAAPHRGLVVEIPDASLANWSSLQKNVKKWSTRVILLYELKIAIEKFGENHLLDRAGPVKGRSLGPHWGRREDLDLCVGTLRHGFGEFETIRADESLSFVGRFRNSSSRPAGEEASAKGGGEAAAAAAAVVVKPEESASVKEEASNRQWNGEGVKGAKANPLLVDLDQLPEWPQHLALVGRLKRILDALRVKCTRTGITGRRSKTKALGNRMTNAKSAAIAAIRSITNKNKRPKKLKNLSSIEIAARGRRDSARERKLRERAAQWTRREQAAFQKAVLSQGKPAEWRLFREAWDMLQFKSDEILEAYYNRFTWALRNASGDATLTQAPEPETKPDEAQILVTAATAYRVKEKIELMDKLAELIRHEEFEERVRCAQRAYDLPTWWSPELDMALLKGVVTYGLGNWDKMLRDPNLAFYNKCIEAELPDNRASLKRIKHLMTMFSSAFKLSSAQKKLRTRSAWQQSDGSPAPSDRTPVRLKRTARSSPTSGSIPRKRKKIAQLDKVEFDGKGDPVMPLRLSSVLQILELGRVKHDHPMFHDSRHIYPVGFKSSRIYPSIRFADRKSEYISEIAESSVGPIFRVVCSDLPEEIIERTTATAAWRQVELKVDTLRGVAGRKTSSVRGNDKFGLDDATVQALIRRLPGADRCSQLRLDAARDSVVPLTLASGATVVELGRVKPHDPLYHDNKNIFPIGFKSTRLYPSTKIANQDAEFTCEVMESSSGPMFRVVCADDPDVAYEKSSATEAWLAAATASNLARGQAAVACNVDGLALFALDEPEVQVLVRRLPNASAYLPLRPETEPPSLVASKVIGSGEGSAFTFRRSIVPSKAAAMQIDTVAPSAASVVAMAPVPPPLPVAVPAAAAAALAVDLPDSEREESEEESESVDSDSVGDEVDEVDEVSEEEDEEDEEEEDNDDNDEEDEDEEEEEEDEEDEEEEERDDDEDDDDDDDDDDEDDDDTSETDEDEFMHAQP